MTVQDQIKWIDTNRDVVMELLHNVWPLPGHRKDYTIPLNLRYFQLYTESWPKEAVAEIQSVLAPVLYPTGNEVLAIIPQGHGLQLAFTLQLRSADSVKELDRAGTSKQKWRVHCTDGKT